jgi:DNA-binding CsgD family transcriptional regulator
MLLPSNLSLLSPLTKRELELLQLVADGGSSAAIAQEQGITAGSLKNVLWRATVKPDADNRGHAIACGFRFGILLRKR